MYINVEDIIPENFLKEPQSVLLEYGNGWGKTHSATSYSVKLQKLKVFDRIYILQYSQRGCGNVVDKVRKFGGFAIWHIGLEFFCPLYPEVSKVIGVGIPSCYFCYACNHFQGKTRYAYMILKETLDDRERGIVKPALAFYFGRRDSRVCTHPILRRYVLDPTSDYSLRFKPKVTPIFVMPAQTFLNHSILAKWLEFARRQKKPRKVLLIIDEADTLLYGSLKTRVPVIDSSNEDRELLAMFSPKRRSLTRILHYYEKILEVLREAYKEKGIIDVDTVSKFRKIVEEVQPYLRSLARRRKKIVEYVFENNIKTNIFKIALALEELSHILYPEYALRTIEVEGGDYIICDYDYAIKLFFDPHFPYKSFWKIVLSATFPTEKIVTSRLLSPESKSLIRMVQKKTGYYQNVYVSIAQVYDDVKGILNRNEETPRATPKILQLLVKLAKFYEENMGERLGGITLWFGNSKQYRAFLSVLKRYRIKYRYRGKYTVIPFKGSKILVSYCGSAIARGLDLDQYDISFVVAPLLRPPRPAGYLDVIDFMRGVAEAVQSAMRIVRAPRPSKPKLVLVESTMATGFYAELYPDWFRKLFQYAKTNI